MNKYTYTKNFIQRVHSDWAKFDCFVSDSFDNFSKAAADLGLKERRILLINERQYGGFYLDQLSKVIGAECRSFDVYEFDPAPEDFNLGAMQVAEYAKSVGLEKTDCIISLGGAVSDILARVYAAEYMPGILYIKIPVTFIGQLLAASDGDAQINIDVSKTPDMILSEAAVHGNVHSIICDLQPDLVYINILAYKNLSEDDRICGIAEALRAAAGYDAELFRYIENCTGNKADDLFEYLMIVVLNVLRINRKNTAKSLETKSSSGLGRTIAVGLERCTNYIIPHGQAMGVGLAASSYVSERRGLLNGQDHFRIAKLMASNGLSVMMNFTNDLIDAICAAVIEAGMVCEDGNTLKEFVVIDRIGHVKTLKDVTLEEVKDAMNYRR